MAYKKHSDVMLLRHNVNELRLRGLSGCKIAKKLKLAESTIYYVIDELKKQDILEISQSDKEQIRRESELRYLREIDQSNDLREKALKREKKLITTTRDDGKSEEREEMLLPDYAAAARFQANLLKAQDSIAGLYGVRQNNVTHKVELTLHQIIAAIPAEEAKDEESE